MEIEGFHSLNDPQAILAHGDRACYGEAPTPHLIDDVGGSYDDAIGFFISGSSGQPVSYLINRVNAVIVKNGTMTIWRRTTKGSATRRRKPYIPSSWAEPVPLP